MRVARTIATLTAAIAMALAMLLQAFPAAGAVPGYDSRYFGESAFVTLQAGEENQFAVGFTNTGATGWQRGTASQVNLVQCCPYNSASPNSSWAVGWLSSTAYATTTTDFVGPGQIGWFVYSVKAPIGATPGDYRFEGDLALASQAVGPSGGMLAPEGYFQLATVPVGPQAATMDVTPDFQFRQIGSSAQFQATVKTSTGAPVPNTNVTCFIDADAASEDLGNRDISLTGNTDANGTATFNYTRAFAGNDSVTCYVTNLPIVRDVATVQWGGAASPVTITPTTAATNPIGTARAYTITTFNATTGAIQGGVTVDITFNELLDTSTTNDPNFAGLTGGTCLVAAPTAPAKTVCQVTTDATSGQVTVTFNSTPNANTITPVAFRDNAPDGDGNNQIGTTEFRSTGGTKTWQAPTPVIVVTPDGASTTTTAGQAVYTITAVDQFGNNFNGQIDIGFLETTDNSTATTTAAQIAWTDGDGSTTTAGTACGTSGDGVAPLATPQHEQITMVNGKSTFAICSTSATSGTPVAWFDTTAGAADTREVEEPQDTGGTATFQAPALTAATLTPTSATNPTSPDATTAAANDVSSGEETYTFTLVDQAGFPYTGTTASSTVTFTVTNNTTGPVTITSCDPTGTPPGTPVTATAAASGGTATCTATLVATDSSATVEIDSATAGSASVSASSVASATGGASLSAGPSTKTWIQAAAEPVCASQGTATLVTGTVLFFDKGTTTADGGSYIASTTVGNFLISYGPVAPSQGPQSYVVLATVTTEANFEANLSLNDVVQWSCPTLTQGETHHITTNN